jgi:hypothetical protein
MVYFEEKQPFSPWAHFILALAMLGALAAIVIALIYEGISMTGLIILAAQIPLFLLLMDLLFMRIRISENELCVQFGNPVPIYWKRISLEDITSVRAVQYRPLRDAGGWGIRFGRFEGEKCRFLNARGDRGVFIDADGQRYIIGSQEPDRLAAVLREKTLPPVP